MYFIKLVNLRHLFKKSQEYENLFGLILYIWETYKKSILNLVRNMYTYSFFKLYTYLNMGHNCPEKIGSMSMYIR